MIFGKMCRAYILFFLAFTTAVGVHGSGEDKNFSAYFPPDVFDANPARNHFKAEWYARALSDLSEPSLLTILRENKDAHVYRFLWLRSFQSPISVRMVINADGTGDVVAEVFTKSDSESKSVRLVRKNALVENNEVENILREVAAAMFWQAETELPTTAESLSGGGAKVSLPPVDGAQWVLEAVRNGKYHVVDRWSPDPNGAYARLCTHFLQMAHLSEGGR